MQLFAFLRENKIMEKCFLVADVDSPIQILVAKNFLELALRNKIKDKNNRYTLKRIVHSMNKYLSHKHKLLHLIGSTKTKKKK